jgi:hypothetical protein
MKIERYGYRCAIIFIAITEDFLKSILSAASSSLYDQHGDKLVLVLYLTGMCKVMIVPVQCSFLGVIVGQYSISYDRP